ncbi:HAMP domain-containing sensor histidine kinase (plasmid) [Paraclostridium ghonii]|uniref:sensor histidine kinase n=1 Tax=Paraclostridium ghonii TaxID=29358 RepID=UPI00202CE2C3|nr:HAMP domain-containing sensor histidine kinase [Paeniclostridium ghonii]MCM0165690.1 HAMP domain-containing histidine kinase [Paeniclostridium ghonii]
MQIINREYTINEKRLLIYVIFSMLALSIVIIATVFFKDNMNPNYLESTLYFIKLFNFMISILGIGSCLISYNRTKNESIFIISLMYIGLSVGILFGHVDYLPFYNKELEISIYIIVSSSLLRICLLILSILPQNKLRNILITNKKISILIVIFLTIIFGTIERRLTIHNYEFSYNFFLFYNVFLICSYIICSAVLFVKSIKEKEYIFVVLSSSISVLAIKAAYAIYISSRLTFYTKLVSVSLTYICFFIVIIGALIELFMYMSSTKILNDNLKLFYSLSENDKHSFMLIFDENMNLLYANKKVLDYYSCGNDVNKLTSIFKDKINLINDENKIIESLNSKNSWRGIIQIEEINITLDCCVQLINSAKNGKEISVTYIDISDVVNRELEVKNLKVYDKEKTEFIANISHELKTPLNLLYSSIQLLDKLSLRESLDFRSIYHKYSKTLRTNCKRMTRLVNNIMDLSKIDLGILTGNLNNYNIISIVEDVTLSVVEYAASKDINIQFDTDEEEQIIKCDASMIERVILNLLSNAIKFSNKNSNIYVNLTIDDNWVKIIVRDEGIGISKENQEIIFDKFVQIDKSFTRENEGSGIGLSIVKSILNLHEGTISVESDLNKGSSFKVFLPNIRIENCDPLIYNIDEYIAELELSDIYEVVT